jgi:hypothetical protein
MHGIAPLTDDRKLSRRPRLAAIARRPGRAVPPVSTISARLAWCPAFARLTLRPALARRARLPVHPVAAINTVAAILARLTVSSPLTGRTALARGTVYAVAAIGSITARSTVSAVLAVQSIAAVFTVLAVTTIDAVLAVTKGGKTRRDHVFNPGNQRHVLRTQFRNDSPGLRLDQFPLPAPLATLVRDDLAEGVAQGFRQLHGGLPRPLR